MKKWDGKTRGNVLGYKIFIFLIKRFGLSSAYCLLLFVAAYFFIFSNKKYIYFYYRNILKFPVLKSLIGIYLSYYKFGQILIDKYASLLGFGKKLSYEAIGEDHLINMQNGGILINAHIGNWELAGQLLVNIKKRVNILMYDGEYQKIKSYLNEILNNRKFNIIIIHDDFSHLIDIDRVLKNNEILCIHGDRFLKGTSFVEFKFLGQNARFPKGPFYLALKYQVPVSFVFSVKVSQYKYLFSATFPKIFPYSNSRNERQKIIYNMISDYVQQLEIKVREYPHQWFNFYDFWGLDT